MNGTKATCSTCRHWEAGEPGECRLAGENWSKMEANGTMEGLAMASQQLLTNPFFGCTQHEPETES